MQKLRFILAFLGCKTLRTTMRLLGRNATYLPGKIALKICPTFLRQIAKPKRIIVVTGTNGKTTVSNLLTDALEKHGMSVLNNSYGSNTKEGIACAFLTGISLTGRVEKGVAVLEVDERSAMHIFPYIDAELVIITNLFRDSIMRNAHPEYIAGILSGNLPKRSKLLLNADDLIVCSVAPNNPRSYFGLERMESDVLDCINLINDFQICPKCQTELKYEYRRYHHVGKATCPSCDFKSPNYDYSGRVDYKTKRLAVTAGEDTAEFALPGDSVFNIYNALTAYAGLREIGLTKDEAVKTLTDSVIPDSRYNETDVNGVKIIMHMGKERNALACSRAFEYVASKPGKKELILMMNGLGDAKVWSENISWLYDCDFEFLNDENITRVVATGARALDYITRLRFAGVPAEKLRHSESETEAPKELALETETSVYIFYGTDSLDLGYKVRDAAVIRANEKRAKAQEESAKR
ncbi:MAG: MurT ligase domain-containing protein [Oscillospiraceae bacterium]|nr:MurT ligase domain-containing protein [Oscillospiraceae bacterium]